MKKSFIMLAALCALGLSVFAQSAKKTLVVYYSWSGNSRIIAQEAQKKTSADIFELELKNPYSTDFNAIGAEVNRDKKAGTLPELKSLPNVSRYDTVILVYPMWQADIALPVQTFLRDSSNALAKKTVAPICSNGSLGLAKTVESIKKAAPKAKVTAGLSIKEAGGSTLSSDLDAWLKKTKILR